MLHVVIPVAVVLGSVYVDIDTLSVSLVTFPVPIVHIAICMPKLASAVSLVSFPVAFVLRSVRPYLDTEPVSLSLQPLSSVDSSIIEDMFFFEFQVLPTQGQTVIIIRVLDNVLTGLLCESPSREMSSVRSLYPHNLVLVGTQVPLQCQSRVLQETESQIKRMFCSLASLD